MHRKIYKTKKEILAAGLTLTLILLQPLSCLTTSAAPAGDSIGESNDFAESNDFTEDDLKAATHISTVDDLIALAENCTLDTWSFGKIFILDADLNLSNTGFIDIPTFSGTFLRQNHTISGLSLSGGRDHMGLFRYIQENGAISIPPKSPSTRQLRLFTVNISQPWKVS